MLQLLFIFFELFIRKEVKEFLTSFLILINYFFLANVFQPNVRLVTDDFFPGIDKIFILV